MEEALVKRVLPHSDEAEQGIIGAMLLDNDAILTANSVISKDDFYSKPLGIVFGVMVSLMNEGKAVDAITVQDRLKETDIPPEYYGIDFFKQIVSGVSISANAANYAEIIYEKSMLRRMIRLNENISNLCYTGKDKLEDVMDMAESEIFKLTSKKNSSDYTPVSEVVLNVIDKIEEAARSKSPVTGMSTGFSDLDVKTSGLQASDLILIAARPSMGKTAFVLNLACHMSVKNHIPTAIFSLEMSKEQLVNRIMAMESQIDAQSLRIGDLSDSDWDKLVESSGIIAESNLIIDDTPGISAGELRSKCRKYKAEHNLQCVIIDYLQLMSGNSGSRNDNRQQEISEISRSLKALARELEVPVIALSQLSRACESRPDHRPMLSDLRESGAIEQDADLVMFLYRDDYYNKDTESKNIAELIIAKQRNGPIGTVELLWMPKYTKFANIERRYS